MTNAEIGRKLNFLEALAEKKKCFYGQIMRSFSLPSLTTGKLSVCGLSLDQSDPTFSAQTGDGIFRGLYLWPLLHRMRFCGKMTTSQAGWLAAKLPRGVFSWGWLFCSFQLVICFASIGIRRGKKVSLTFFYIWIQWNLNEQNGRI